jgi:hypothetical protein
MVCPLCFHDGLEAHPGFAPDYEGDAEILRATRCPNEDCNYHYDRVPTNSIEEQFVRSSFLAGVTSDIDAMSVVMALVVLGGVVFLATNVFGVGIPGLGAGVDVSLSGQVVSETGTPVANTDVSLARTDVSATTGPDGSYRFENLSAGEYVLLVDPGDDALAARSAAFTVGSNGDITTQAETGAIVNETALRVNVSKPVQQTASQSVTNGSFVLSYSNPVNAARYGGVTVGLEPPSADVETAQTSVPAGTEQRINVPGVLESQSLTVESGVGQRQVTQSDRWTGTEPASVKIDGNLAPSAFQFLVSDNANTRNRTISRSVSNGTEFTGVVQGAVRDGFELTIGGGSATASTTKTGVYSGQNPELNVGDDAAPAQVDVTVTGNERTSQRTTSGTVQQGVATVGLDGKLDARGVTLEFTGGTSDSEPVGSTNATADAGDEPETRQPVLFEASTNGEYLIDYDFSATRNSDLVDAGFKVNGELTTVAEGTGQQTLTLSGSDTVRLWVDARQESTSTTKDYDRDGHSIYVTETTVSDDQVAAGEPLSVTATLENRGDAYGVDVYLFQDGSRAKTENEYFGGGVTKQVTFTTRFAEAGTYTVSVNEGDPITVQVGDGTVRSGAGSINATASEVGDGGKVNVDTTGDGTPDSTVAADGGAVSLGTRPAGNQSIAVSQQGVTQTGFTVQYDARFGASGVAVDIDDDGVLDIDVPGVLADGETRTATASVDGGRNTVGFDVANNGSVAYEITYAEAGQVNAPTLYADDAVLVDETKSFTGEKTYQFDTLERGTHTFRVQSENASNEFDLELSWTERADDLYPTLLIDGESVCQPNSFTIDSTCTVASPGVGGDELSLRFDGGAPSFRYTFRYTASATADQVDVEIDGETKQYRRGDAASRMADGSWAILNDRGRLATGHNQVNVSESSPGTVQPPVNATFEYSFQAKQPKTPSVVVRNADGETFTKSVPASTLGAGEYLSAPVELSLPAEWFTRGENEIRVRSSNGGVVVTNVTATTGESGEVRFRGNDGE